MRQFRDLRLRSQDTVAKNSDRVPAPACKVSCCAVIAGQSFIPLQSTFWEKARERNLTSYRRKTRSRRIARHKFLLLARKHGADFQFDAVRSQPKDCLLRFIVIVDYSIPYFSPRNSRRLVGSGLASSCQVSILQRMRRSTGHTHFITANQAFDQVPGGAGESLAVLSRRPVNGVV